MSSYNIILIRPENQMPLVKFQSCHIEQFKSYLDHNQVGFQQKIIQMLMKNLQ
ncbi:unnamed protein product [Paramecium octaurelia]|uniref:Uncharacterized protein n=1 Tax=Paramecium octaurelia TaxID=43137 RepID=A0A8S1WQJ7_PAROT|nr:unnamed protein product [Paramecium octaurelia]